MHFEVSQEVEEAEIGPEEGGVEAGDEEERQQHLSPAAAADNDDAEARFKATFATSP